MSDDWYVRQAGQVQGPFTSIQVRRLVLQGELALNDEISADRQRWQPLAAVPLLVPHQLRHGAEEEERQLLEEKRTQGRQARMSLLLAGLVLLVLIGLVAWQEQPAEVQADCAMSPAPGVNWQDCRFAALVAPQADLRGVILTNGAIPGARLQGANLSAGDLRYADLQQADLSYSRLIGARLVGADLRGADLTYAQLSDADLSHADLRDARLGGAELKGALLYGAIWIDGHRCDGRVPGVCGADASP